MTANAGCGFPASAGNIPLQLVKANPATGNGAMTGVTFIQRVATKGGVAPATACDGQQGQERDREVPGGLHHLQGDVSRADQAPHRSPVCVVSMAARRSCCYKGRLGGA